MRLILSITERSRAVISPGREEAVEMIGGSEVEEEEGPDLFLIIVFTCLDLVPSQT